MGQEIFPVMWGRVGMGQEKSTRGGDKDPILRPHPAPLPPLVYTGGIWSFDNQALLLTRWKSGMTVTNVRFDSVSLWVQRWGAPFDIRTARVAEEVGNQLGRVLEVEKRRNIDGHNFFMRVKVAIPLEKKIRRGAFLARSDGKKFWVDLKYERLPILCHYCGLLGHELCFCA
ncbi:uncharacterized protein At4g02000-like [Quercus suber]|uniref:uncharacterized protein At4g02000-like n=1 Tax=Quercus suber TaxID=58331 RepID=UPI0032DE2D9A